MRESLCGKTTTILTTSRLWAFFLHTSFRAHSFFYSFFSQNLWFLFFRSENNIFLWRRPISPLILQHQVSVPCLFLPAEKKALNNRKKICCAYVCCYRILFMYLYVFIFKYENKNTFWAFWGEVFFCMLLYIVCCMYIHLKYAFEYVYLTFEVHALWFVMLRLHFQNKQT